jgi:hypothetical protein
VSQSKEDIAIVLEDGSQLRVAMYTSEPEFIRLPTNLKASWKQANDSARQAKMDTERGTAIGLQCRCALLVATITGLVEWIEPTTIAGLIHVGDWTLDEAIVWISRMPDERKKAQAIVATFHLVPEEYQIKLLSLIGDIRSKLNEESLPQPHMVNSDNIAYLNDVSKASDLWYLRIETLASIFPHLPLVEKEDALSTILQSVFAKNFRSHRGDILSKLMPHLPEKQVREMLDLALQLPASG